MSSNKSASFAKVLQGELPVWRQQGLIDDKTAETLSALYPIPESKNRIVGVLTILGSVLVGLGVLLFVGSNWEQLTSTIKLAIIIAAVALANFGGWYFQFNQSAQRPKLGQSLFLLGSLLYGAGIWLVAQIYQLDLDWSLGLSLWSIGLVPMALITHSLPLAILNSLVLLSWGCSGQHPLLISVFGLGIAIALSYVFRSRTCLVFALCQGDFLCFSPNNLMISGAESGVELCVALLFWSAALFVWYVWHKVYKPLYAKPFLYVSLLTSLPMFLAISFAQSSESIHWQYPVLVAQLIFATGSGVYVGSKAKAFIPEILGAFITVLLMVICITLANPLLLKSVSNIVLFSSLIALLFSGARRLDSVAIVNIATVFFAIGIFCRYFDTFFKMVDRSAFFIIGGIIFLIGGYLLEQQRRTLIRSIVQ